MKKIIKTTKKKTLLTDLLLTVAFILTISTVSNFSLLAQFGGGQGTQADPYRIYTKQHLDELADSIANSPSNISMTGYNWSRDKHFKVMNNITNPVTRVIGGVQPHLTFQGDFDGQNNTITVNINVTAMFLDAGLFSYVWIASIKNVIITGSINTTSLYSHAGGIVAVIAAVRGAGEIGIEVKLNVRISNCINSADITSNSAGGGIVGTINESAVVNNNNNFELIIENCTNIGTIKGSLAGDILGNIDTDVLGVCIINNCINDGLIDGSYAAGGIAGGIKNGATVSNCFNGGVVSGNIKNNVGCIVGIKEAGATVINNHYDMQMCGEE